MPRQRISPAVPSGGPAMGWRQLPALLTGRPAQRQGRAEQSPGPIQGGQSDNSANWYRSQCQCWRATATDSLAGCYGRKKRAAGSMGHCVTANSQPPRPAH